MRTINADAEIVAQITESDYPDFSGDSENSRAAVLPIAAGAPDGTSVTGTLYLAANALGQTGTCTFGGHVVGADP